MRVDTEQEKVNAEWPVWPVVDPLYVLGSGLKCWDGTVGEIQRLHKFVAQ